MRAYDWSASPLGAPAGWPQPLKTLVGVMLAANQAMFVAWGSEGILLYNDAYAEILGGKHPAALGQPFFDAWFELRDSVGPIMDRGFAGEPTYMDDIELLMVRKGYPEETHFSFCYAPVRGDASAEHPEGRVEGVYCACVETTEKVFAERRAAFRSALEERLRGLADPAAITAAAAEMLGRRLGPARVGYSEADESGKWLVVGHDWCDGRIPSSVGHHRISDFGQRLCARLCAGESVAIGDVREADCLGGAQAVAAFEARSIRAALIVPLAKEGRLVATLFVHDAQPRRWRDVEIDLARDVAERTWAAVERAHAEKALVEERDRARSYLQVAGVMLLVLDTRGRIETINRRGAEILGHADEAALIGRDWFELALPARIRAGMRAIFDRLMTGAADAVEEYENPVLCAGGGERLIAWRNTLLHDEDGRIVGTLSSGEDVTDARRAQAVLARDKAELERLVEERTAQLVQSQKMEAIGLLTGGVAHDFNNVLQTLGSCLFVLDRHVPDGDPRRLFDSARQSIDRGARLTQALLAFARRQMLVPQAIDLGELFDGLGPLLERTLGGLIRIAVEVGAGTPHALVDRAQLESVLLNLVINARDAMPFGGYLKLRAGPATVGRAGRSGQPAELEPGEYVAISVEDTGSGMDEATLARVFEPFFTTKEPGKGTGLGLSLVHGMAVQSGGAVAITSRPGLGTAVTLYLPSARAVEAEPDRVEPGPPTCPGGTVLLVDDNDFVRTAVQMTLEGLGYSVLAANGGEAALRILQGGEAVDVLVTDYAMPGMNGAELTRAARRANPLLPVLQITGYADRPDDIGDVAVLHKPFTPQDLGASLAALLSRGAVASRSATDRAADEPASSRQARRSLLQAHDLG